MARYPVGADGRLIMIVVDGELPEETVTEADRPPVDGAQEWDGTHWRWPIEVAREKRRLEIEARYNAALETGCPYEGSVVQIRVPDQLNISAMGNEARAAKRGETAWPALFAWRMQDNSFLTLPTADSMIALGEAVKARVYMLRLVKWGHDDAIAQLSDPTAVMAYNIETGWE